MSDPSRRQLVAIADTLNFVNCKVSNVFDRCVCYGSFSSQRNQNFTTDDNSEFFMRAPARGRILVIVK